MLGIVPSHLQSFGCSHGLRTPIEFFFENHKLWVLGRQIGQEFLGNFGYWVQLQHPSWHCESFVHSFEYFFFFYKIFGFQAWTLGLTLWNLSCLEFKFNDTRLSYWHKNKIGRIENFFSIFTYHPLEAAQHQKNKSGWIWQKSAFLINT